MYPKIGVASIITLISWEVLLSKRRIKNWNWAYSFPGWHLELWEDIIACAKRELLEEAWIYWIWGDIIGFTEDIFTEDKHYITFFVKFETFEGQPTVTEPDKNEEWRWYDFNNLPEPLFLPIIHLIRKYWNQLRI